MADDLASLAYVLGHEDWELGRLASQARLVDPATRWFFSEAGIARGMRVLDVGSGAGDVAFLVASLVGPEGEVVGTDRSAAALARARARARAHELGNVSFVEGDPSKLAFERPFDAVVGRWVLMYQPDPGAFLKKLKAQVRPGGVIVFHEADHASARSSPSVPIFETSCALVAEVMRRAGHHTDGAHMLARSFLAAGLPPPTMRTHAVTAAGAPDAVDEVRLLTDLVRALSHEIVRQGLAAAADLDPEVLTERILAGMAQANAVITHRADVAAWCRL
jgi:SAM-dependent methyltransferase